MAGRVPFETIPDYYALIDIAPIPRRPDLISEIVSPIKPLEAMAMGAALVVSDVAPLKEMVRDGETGAVFRKGDIDDLYRTLKQLLLDEGLRGRLSDAGEAHVRHNRRWEMLTAEAARFMGLQSSELTQ